MNSPIQSRRSIRRYQDTPLPSALVEAVVQAGALAPSSKNRQPWYFVAVTGSSKGELLEVMSQGLIRERSAPLLPGSAPFLSGAEHTLAVMAQAPVILLAVNPLGMALDRPLSPEERVSELCNTQSLGAAMENMALAATELGLGSLWICDTFFAQAELTAWLDVPGQLLAAMTLGYPAEEPPARPRKALEEIREWRT